MNGQDGAAVLSGTRAWLAGVEPSAVSGGPSTTRSSPTRSIEDEVLTEVFVGVGEVGRGLPARKHAQGKSVRSRGPCSASPLWFFS
jgi:hypothetical protein